MTFQLDTSGAVICTANVFPTGEHPMIVKWSGLPPFTQGYVEALFEQAFGDYRDCGWAVPAFRDLAPETLARIIADCERYASKFRPSPNRSAGADFWRDRQRNASHFVDGETCRSLKSMGFPVLTVQLGDDGKVRFV